MELSGKNLIAGTLSAAGSETITPLDPRTGQDLEPTFAEASDREIDRAFDLAEEAFRFWRGGDPEERAELLELIAEKIEALGDELVERVQQETALPEGRVKGERGRTTGQIRLFAEVIRDGSWVEARIDPASEEGPDVRRMLQPLGPVGVFGASNFPLAFSVAGGDTISALAAGCPVVYKAHPGHPGTSELVGRMIAEAVEECNFPDGTFSLLHGASPDVGQAVAKHPAARAIGFTGSLAAGRAIFDAATARPEPIPVYAEMGSVNPVFVLPGVLPEKRTQIADGLAESVTMATGQFCTNPGLVFGLEGDGIDAFVATLGEKLADEPVSHMLYPGIRDGFEEGCQRMAGVSGVEVAHRYHPSDAPAGTEAAPVVFTTDGATFLQNEALMEEVFGPSTLVVKADSAEELTDIAQQLNGDLTASLHGSEEDLQAHTDLMHVLERRVGRLIFNGFPTGVRVCHAMHHGGPYPATTDVRTTSVGTAAIKRFARPIAYQDVPDSVLPVALRNRNERDIWRLLDGEWTKEDV